MREGTEKSTAEGNKVGRCNDMNTSRAKHEQAGR